MQVAKVDLMGMPFKKRVEYIWDYYKLYIIGTLAVIFFVGSFIYGQVTKINCAFNITFTVNAIHDDNMSTLEDELTKLIVNPDEKRTEAMISVIPVSESTGIDAGTNMQMMQKFTVQVAASEIDLLVIDKLDIDGMVSQGLLLNLNEVSGLNVNGDLLIKAADGKDYGISLANSGVLKAMDFNTENMVLAVCASSKRLESAPKVIEWFLK